MDTKSPTDANTNNNFRKSNALLETLVTADFYNEPTVNCLPSVASEDNLETTDRQLEGNAVQSFAFRLRPTSLSN